MCPNTAQAGLRFSVYPMITLSFMTILPPSVFWDYGSIRTHLVCVVRRIKSRAAC